MGNRRTYSCVTAAVLAGALLVPAAALARGGGFAHFGHGPVFGLHHSPVVAHRPFRRPGVQHFSARFPGWWRLHRFARHRGANWTGVADGDGYYPASTYDPGDVTGALAPPPAVFAPPGGPPPERVGCFSRGYEVPGESGGVARVTVTRC